MWTALLFSAYGIYNFLIHSPYFKIKEIKIEGNQDIANKDILMKIKIRKGDNIFKVSLRKAKRELGALKQIKDTDIHRDFPDRIVIKITERVPIAQIWTGTEGHSHRVELIDKEGITFPGRKGNIPKILGTKDSLERWEIVNFLAKLMDVDFGFYKRISYIDRKNPRRVEVKTERALLIWGPVGKETETQMEKKLAYLNLVLEDLINNGRNFDYVDLRFLKEGKGEVIVG